MQHDQNHYDSRAVAERLVLRMIAIRTELDRLPRWLNPRKIRRLRAQLETLSKIVTGK